MLHTSFYRTCAAMRRDLLVRDELGARHGLLPGEAARLRKPTVTTLRKNGRRLQCSGLPGSEDASSGQSSFMMAA
jgi:hypothetical protein